MACTLVADQRGEPRPADGDCDTLAVCDLGAYEVQECMGPTLYDSDTPDSILDPGNARGLVSARPHDHPIEPGTHYFQIDDGTGYPGTIFLVKTPGTVRFTF